MTCPKCGIEIKRFDLSPNCRNCGVNLTYFSQEKGLIHDAKLAELEFAGARIFVAKLKATFIDGKVQIARMVLTVLCIASLAVPFATVNVSIPLYSAEISAGAIGAYNLIANGVYLAISDFVKLPFISQYACITSAMLGAFVLLALSTAIVFLSELLSFINIKKTAGLICIFSAASIFFAAAVFVLAIILRSMTDDVTFISVRLGLGSAVSVIAFAAMLAINIFTIKKDFQPKISPNDILRSNTLKKVKSGEINIDDLPLPVFESPEEKEKRLREYYEMQERAGGDSDE